MKKILFNDKFGLTAAVLNGRKTQTRRIINAMPKDPKIAYGLEEEAGYVHLLDGYTVVAKSRFKIGEVVAVAQSYFDIKTSANSYRPPIWEGYKDWRLEDQPPFDGCLYDTLESHVVNILPWITPAGYKVTEKRIIELYK